MSDVDGLRERAMNAPEQTVTDVNVTGVWMGSRHHLTIAPAELLGLLDRLAAAEAALRRIVSDEVWNGADDPEDVMVAIAQEALKPVVAAEVLRGALDDPGSDAGVAVALGATDAEWGSQIDWSNTSHGECPRCGEVKFIGHGPLCLDCYSNTGHEKPADDGSKP